MCANCVATADAAVAAIGGLAGLRAGLGAGRDQVKEVADGRRMRAAAVLASLALAVAPFVLAFALGA